MREYVVQLDGSEVEQGEQENAGPACEEEQADGSKVVAVLGRKAAAQGLPRPEVVESAVALDRSRNLETRGAQQADPFANLAVKGNHHLRPEQDVVVRPAARRIHDVVPHEVAGPDRRSGYEERAARDLVIHQNQPASDHRSGADRAQGRSEEHTSELQSRLHLVCRLLLEKKKNTKKPSSTSHLCGLSST